MPRDFYKQTDAEIIAELREQRDQMLTILKAMVVDAEKCGSPRSRLFGYKAAKAMIAKVDGN